ncbi:MAG: GNAT family N-acetyltransferase [Nitrospiraceae bacterium]|nr:MAG: GNAT family N-acetyltransferase [Nitrospiraceae bacterium]
MKDRILLRSLCDDDISEYADMLYKSFNKWYWKHGWSKDYFGCRTQETSIFYDIYNDLTPGKSVAAFDKNTGKMMGACFYHPREYHVSLGIMSVHPDYFGIGVGRRLVDHIINYVKTNGYKSCRLVSSAMNIDSFSLYNRAGFIPRMTYQDVVINVPVTGIVGGNIPGDDRVREARHDDVQKMAELEMEISKIKREMDYRYSIDNPRGVLHATVYENNQQTIDGFMISVKHPALNMLGPCVARDEEITIALIKRELERFKGTWVLLVVPIQKRKIIEQLYAWKAVNVEIHLKEVWGEFEGFNGIAMPSFLPETG